MAMLENALEGNVAALAAAGAATLVLPVIFPRLVSPLRGLLKSGVILFLESEAEAEGGIIGRLAETTVQALLETVTAHTSRDTRQQEGEATVQQFEATARARAQRYGWNDADAAARYRRHVAHFRRAVAKAQADASPRRRELLGHVADVLNEDW